MVILAAVAATFALTAQLFFSLGRWLRTAEDAAISEGSTEMEVAEATLFMAGRLLRCPHCLTKLTTGTREGLAAAWCDPCGAVMIRIYVERAERQL